MRSRLVRLGRFIQAKASQDTATFYWTLNGKDLSSENTVTARGKDEEYEFIMTAPAIQAA